MTRHPPIIPARDDHRRIPDRRSDSPPCPKVVDRVQHPWAIPRLAASVLLCWGAASLATNFDAETERLLVEAVEAASAVDLYHARCRGDVSGRRMDNLNKTLVSKLRTTVLAVQDDLFPEHNYRLVQQRLEQDFLATLRAAGGCQGAKEAGLPDQLRDRYDEMMKAIQTLP